jgi:hypothetical protein
MQNRWSESEAAGNSLRRCPAKRSVACSSTPRACLGRAGPGHARRWQHVVQRHGRQRSRRSQPALFIKASGGRSGGGFVRTISWRWIWSTSAAARSTCLFFLTRPWPSEFACHGLRPSGKRRASVESLVHAVLPHAFVLHTHPSAILALTNRSVAPRPWRRRWATRSRRCPMPRAGWSWRQAVRDTMTASPGQGDGASCSTGSSPGGKRGRPTTRPLLWSVGRKLFWRRAARVCCSGLRPSPDREQRYRRAGARHSRRAWPHVDRQMPSTSASFLKPLDDDVACASSMRPKGRDRTVATA